MDYQALHYIYRAAAEAPTGRTLLLLHGTGGDERDLLPLAQHFGPGLNVLSLRGNVLEGGMPRFFRRLGMGVFDEDDVRFRTHELAAFLRQISQEKGFDLNQVVAAGYSNGANIAGGLLLLYPELLAGAVLWRPMQPLTREVPSVTTSRPAPVFFNPGQHDPTVNPAATDRYEALLSGAGFALTRLDAPAGHNLTPADVAAAAAWYRQHFGAAGQ
ncbi:carboxylesterase [Hymenobacter gummosus]|uniref:Carboxylesterase n=1 Tax=Hymenobacter gummosus TaxID=1776032 RepID=A0A3S0IPJ0_9BACT|nr:carboxylesterase [Hymenobacter gummosus]RTQ50717.1 carboxylesterase [Hymenobacter gummosus]